MIRILAYLWQLPQNLLGLALVTTFGYADSIPYKGARIYTCDWIGSGGVSLGRYIILGFPTAVNVCHEYGHSRQSLMLGPAYLPVVGLWSAIRLRLRLYRRGEYYKGFPESWADRLGGVYIDIDGTRKAAI